MMTKNKKVKMFLLPALLTTVGIVTGSYFFLTPELPVCRDEVRVNLNLSKMFVEQVESVGAKVIGLGVHNQVDSYDKETDVRFCSSIVNLRIKQNNVERKLLYQTDFNLKWGNKEDNGYFIEVLKFTHLNDHNDHYKKDLQELTTGIKPAGFFPDGALPALTFPLYQTPSLQTISDTTEDVIHHDIIFFATTKDSDAFVTLFKENDQTVFVMGGKDGINYQYIIPKMELTSTAGGSLYFEDDGVRYKLTADKIGGVTLHIHDDSGNYEIPLDTTNAQYVNRIPPLSKQ